MTGMPPTTPDPRAVRALEGKGFAGGAVPTDELARLAAKHGIEQHADADPDDAPTGPVTPTDDQKD